MRERVAVNDGGPAFPRHLPKIELPPDQAVSMIKRYEGMTLRDWLAGQALAVVWQEEIRRHPGCTFNWPVVAFEAYKLADAMLAEREQER